jgi:hypothetical protein
MQIRGKAALALVVAGAMGFGGVAVSCGGGDDSSAPATADASPDVVFHDAGSVTDDDAGSVCAPFLPAGYSSAYVPPVTTNTACTSAQVQAFYDNCFATTSTSTGCQTFYNAAENKACVTCMYTPQGSAAYGAVIALTNGTAEANIAGCVALVDGDNSPTSCAAKYQAGQFCEIDACSGCVIDSSDNTTFTAFTKCESAAGTGICAADEADGGCEKAAKYAACNTATTFEQYMIALGNQMCASGNVSDAGVDSGDAGDADVGDANDDAGDASDDAADGS